MSEEKDQSRIKQAYLGIVIRSQNFVHSLLAKEVVLEVIWILAITCRRGCVHPLQFLGPFLSGLLLLEALKFLQLAFFLLLLAQLIKLLLLLELRGWVSVRW